MTEPHLFAAGYVGINGEAYAVQHIDAATRMQRVRECRNVTQLREALEARDLQQGVRRAILARIKRLERAA